MSHGPRRKRKILDSLLIKPAGPDCNLDCAYCFYSPRASLFPGTPHPRMGAEVLEETLRQFLGGDRRSLGIGWQGGEPTLMGLGFFEKAMELEARFGDGKAVANALQTNGLLLDRRWARFLRDHAFLVGLSIDGPALIHDEHRRNAAGQGTLAAVVDRAKLLLDEGVPVNALAVVNRHSVRYAREIHGFLRSLGLVHMQFIPCVDPRPGASGREAPLSPDAGELGEFLIALFDLWSDGIGTPFQTDVRFFEALLFGYAGQEPPDCQLRPACGDYLVVEHNGDVFPCDFYVEDGWRLGNVMTGRLEHMRHSARHDAFERMKPDLPGACRSCPWLERCRGGCPRDRVPDASGEARNRYCAGLKALFAHADAPLRALAAGLSRPPIS